MPGASVDKKLGGDYKALSLAISFFYESMNISYIFLLTKLDVQRRRMRGNYSWCKRRRSSAVILSAGIASQYVIFNNALPIRNICISSDIAYLTFCCWPTRLISSTRRDEECIGIAPGASVDEARRSFKAFALALHPDNCYRIMHSL